MKVFPELAQSALKTIADYYSMDVMEAAEGILRIAVPNMASAIRTMTIERGIDPRDFTMVSFGGAGPLHANLIACELQIERILVSTMPGNFSAWGMLTADLRRDYVQTYVATFDRLEMRDLEERFLKMEAQARQTMNDEGISVENLTLIRELDVRYIGQGHALTLAAPSDLSESDSLEIQDQFDGMHLKRYLHNTPSQAKEVVTLRLASIGQMKKASLSHVKSGSAEPVADALRLSRNVYLDGAFKMCKIYDRSRLLAKNVIRGPALIEEKVSTTLLLEGYKAEVDQ